MLTKPKTYINKLIPDNQGVDLICSQLLNQRNQEPLKFLQPLNQQMLDENFTCSICTEYVTEPLSCSECNKLNCKKCLERYLPQNPACPNCRKPHSKDKIDLTLNNILNDSFWQCKNCNQTFKHSERMGHRVTCDKESLDCPSVGCRKTNYPSLSSLKQHLLIECDFCPGVCD